MRVGAVVPRRQGSAMRAAAVAGLVCCYAAATTNEICAQQAVVETLEAVPMITEWAPRLETGDSSTISEFWRIVTESGTPLVAPDTSTGYSIVTFVARGGPDTERMRLDSNLTSLLVEDAFLAPSEFGWMSRIEGSDVWHLSLRLRNDLRVPYRLARYPAGEDAALDIDPLNPRVWEPGVEALRASILELPDAPEQPWRNSSGEEGAGDWDELSADDGSGRTVYVYKPPQWGAEGQSNFPVLIGLGAFGHGIGMRVDRMVDHLIESSRLPPLIVVLVDLTNEDESTRYQGLGDFLLGELLPYVRDQYRVSAEPGDVVVSGTSRRGMAASLLALRHPETFGNVLSLSGSYYWRPDDEPFEWLPRRYAFAEPVPVRFYLAAGELETWVSPGNRGHYLLATNRHMRDVLEARGYDLKYVEFNGVHSELNWQDWLADGLVRFLGTDDSAQFSRH